MLNSDFNLQKNSIFYYHPPELLKLSINNKHRNIEMYPFKDKDENETSTKHISITGTYYN